MLKIVRFPSPGGKRLRGAVLSALVLIAAGPAFGDDYADGAAAFAARDYTSAATSWRKAADAGSAEAVMQLGLIADLGLGMKRDAKAAFAFYQRAAEMSLPDAAFNVAVMLDAGIDVSRDLAAAGVWYARAALGGNKRAALNLGLMYQDGSGVPANDELAAYWFGTAAATLPAAKAALQRLKTPRVGPIAAPDPLSAAVLQQQGTPRADLVWTAKPGPQGSVFAVQVVSGSEPVAKFWTQETTASAVQIPVATGGMVWRVARIDPVAGRYKASAWQHQIGPAGVVDPAGLVSFVVNAGDIRAAALARDLSVQLQANGLAVSIATAAAPLATSAIRYRYQDDAGFAGDLAGLLPGFTASTVTRSADLKSGPGEVVIDLVLQPVATVAP